MKLVSENRLVEKYFSDFDLMRKEIGQELAITVKKRCDQLKAADNFSVYLLTGLGKPHPLVGNLKGCYGITISHNIRLVVKPNVESFDSASLRECDSVIIKGVVEYHGQTQKWFIP